MNKRFSTLLIPLMFSISSHALGEESDSNQGSSQSATQPTAAKLQQSNVKADNKNKQMKNSKKSKDAEAPSAIVVPQ